MKYLIDSGILLRIHDPVANPYYPTLRRCLRILWANGDELCYTLQNLAEFWNVCTRPSTARGGLGISVVETHRRARIIERNFTLLVDTRKVYDEWRRLLTAHGVMGVQVHDARLVAAMSAHNVTHLLTLNAKDFNRYQGITIVAPDDVVNASVTPGKP